MTSGYGVNRRVEEEEMMVGDQMLVEKEPITMGATSLEEDEEEEGGRVAGFILQGKKVISTGFTARQVLLLVVQTLSFLLFVNKTKRRIGDSF